jgi:DNA-directed RNA polymerase subunit K/omega
VTDDEGAGPASMIGPLGNRFYVISVACQRVMQIRNGARLHVDPRGHKECVVAVAEVMAGTVSCYVS